MGFLQCSQQGHDSPGRSAAFPENFESRTPLSPLRTSGIQALRRYFSSFDFSASGSGGGGDSDQEEAAVGGAGDDAGCRPGVQEQRRNAAMSTAMATALQGRQGK